MNKINDFWQFVVDKTIYEKNSLNECKEEIQNSNAKILQTMLFAVMLILGVNFALSFSLNMSLNQSVGMVSWVYLLTALLSLALFVWVKICNRKYIIGAIYIVYSIAFVYAFIISGLMVPNDKTVSFILIIFMVSTLYLDYGWRIHLFMTISTIVYVVAISYYKTPYAFKSEMENSYTVLFLLFIIGTIVRNARVDGFVTQHTLHKYAYLDQLTAVSNRRRLFEDFAEFEEGKDKTRVTAITLLDVDKFKLYNDTYGHSMGDDCLREIGKCLNKLEEYKNIRCYRYGGEEFAIIFIDMEEDEIKLKVSEFMNMVLELKHEHKSSEHKIVTVSVGTAFMPKEEKPRFALGLSVADKALYRAKETGRNRAEYSCILSEEGIVSFDKVRSR